MRSFAMFVLYLHVKFKLSLVIFLTCMCNLRLQVPGKGELWEVKGFVGGGRGLSDMKTG